MKKLLSIFAALFFMALPVKATETIHVCAGSASGIYTEAAKTLKDFVDPTMVDLVVETTNGTWDNVKRTVMRPKVDGGQYCDVMFGQPDGWMKLHDENAAQAKVLISVMDFHREYAQLLCSKEANFKSINSYEGSPTLGLKKHNMIVGASESGAWLVLDNWGRQDSSYSGDNIEMKFEVEEAALVELEQGRAECMLVPAAVPTVLVAKASTLYKDSIELVEVGDWDLNDTVDDRGKPVYSYDHKIDTGMYPDFGYWSDVKTISWNAKLYFNTERVSPAIKSHLLSAAKRAQQVIQSKYVK